MTAVPRPLSNIMALAAALAALTCAAPAVRQAAASERAVADVTCRETAVELKYACTIRLSRRRDGAPIAGARIAIKADMSNMPMAHNVRPVTAVESETPGSYQATLFIEMHGRWTLRLRISGPLRDIVVATVDFGRSPGHVRTVERTGVKGFADPRDRKAVRRGRRMFAENCAACHGNTLQGELRAGLFPPKREQPAPPLDGGGHSAHHSDADMFSTVKGASAGDARRMPRFGARLSDKEIWAVLSYIKSRWPAAIRRYHAQMFPRRR